MKYDVLVYGQSVLRHKAEPVKEFDDKIKQLSEDMLETMYANNGLGLAAEQIGRTESICVVDVSDDPSLEQNNPDLAMPLVLINPEIKEAKGESVCQEGCLSFPEIYVEVTRAEELVVTYSDLKGESREINASGLLARAVQHELDHLNGVLLVDRMSASQKTAIAGKLKRLKKKNS